MNSTTFLTLSIIKSIETIDGSAVEEEDYKPLNEVLTFEPNEQSKEVRYFYSFKPIFIDDN